MGSPRSPHLLGFGSILLDLPNVGHCHGLCVIVHAAAASETPEIHVLWADQARCETWLYGTAPSVSPEMLCCSDTQREALGLPKTSITTLCLAAFWSKDAAFTKPVPPGVASSMGDAQGGDNGAHSCMQNAFKVTQPLPALSRVVRTADCLPF